MMGDVSIWMMPSFRHTLWKTDGGREVANYMHGEPKHGVG